MLRLVSITALLIAISPKTARAVPFEIEASLGGQTIGVGGPVGWLAGPGALIGIGLGDRLVLMTGLTVHGGWSSSTGSEMRSLSINVPLELKFYLREPLSTRLLPTLRLGAAYGLLRASYPGSNTQSHRLQGRLGFGAQYLVTRNVGFGVELGLAVAHSIVDAEQYLDTRSWQVGLDWRAGLVLRF